MYNIYIYYVKYIYLFYIKVIKVTDKSTNVELKDEGDGVDRLTLF